jgi:DNA/RNA-binding domain of Phe-tRNA-synthetase-like protein
LRREPPVSVAPEDPALPGVRLVWCAFDVTRNPLRRSSPALRRQLHALSDRHGGPRAITQSTREIPDAYRRLFRKLGEGERRSPAEELTIKRLIRGQYRSRGVLRDALLIATVDTEVGVWALDAERLSGDPRLSAGAVADDTGPIAAPFTDPELVGRGTRRLVLYALTAPDVPDVAVTEALYVAWEIIDSA